MYPSGHLHGCEYQRLVVRPLGGDTAAEEWDSARLARPRLVLYVKPSRLVRQRLMGSDAFREASCDPTVRRGLRLDAPHTHGRS